MVKVENFLIVTIAMACLFAAGNVQAADVAVEWIDIPVVVNIVDSADANNVGAAIDKANEILKQTHIKLVVKKTNKNVNVGNNDANLTGEEGGKAQEDGQNELDNTFKGDDGKWNGKGIKITVGDDCWVEESNTIGWSVHRNPVMVVEGGAEPNSLGGTIAHELIHILTVTDHSDDPNDVMYPTDEGGTNIDPNDVNEITPEAKKRGTAYLIIPVRRSGGVMVPADIEYSIDVHGAILDGFHDLQISDPLGIINDPNEPSIQYADIREVSIFVDEPFSPSGIAKFEIHLGGLIPQYRAETFFNIAIECDPNQAGPDVSIHTDPVNLPGHAMVSNMHNPISQAILPVMVHLNPHIS